MRRKVSKRGERGLIVTLPKVWAWEQGIRAFDFIEMTPEGDRLILEKARPDDDET